MTSDIRRIRIAGICVLTVTALYLFTTEFALELFAVGWHLCNGGAAHLKSFDGKRFDVPVPAFFYAQLDQGGWGTSLTKRPGRLRALLGKREWAFMTFSVAPAYSTANDIMSGAAAVKDRAGVSIHESRRVSVAGQDLHCFERNWERGEMAELRRAAPMVELDCVPKSDKRGFSATFLGTPNLVPVFYNTLERVQRKER